MNMLWEFYPLLAVEETLAPLSDSQILLNWMQMQDLGKSLN